MTCATVTMHDETALLRLEGGTTNAIGSALTADLTTALAEVRASAAGMVLAGNTKFLSIGLNLPELVGYDRPAMIDFFTRFDRAIFDLYTLPVPTACAMAGHAVAGGCVLALACDFRFAATGKKLIGLNEATIGLPVPYLPDLMLRQLVGDRVASDMMYSGRFLPTERAVEVGLVDELLPAEAVEERALAAVTELAARPRRAFALLKESRTEAVRAAYERNNRVRLERMLECWFDDDVQPLLREASQKF